VTKGLLDHEPFDQGLCNKGLLIIITGLARVIRLRRHFSYRGTQAEIIGQTPPPCGTIPLLMIVADVRVPGEGDANMCQIST
jgi:hypothetical protein